MANLIKFYINFIYLIVFLDIYLCDTTDDITTIEPGKTENNTIDNSILNFFAEASTGCAAPAIRFTRPRASDTTTEQTYAQFETTQIYSPEDLTTTDVEFIEKIDIDLSNSDISSAGGGSFGSTDKYVGINPYRIEPETGDAIDGHGDDIDDEDDDDDGHTGSTKIPLNNRRRNRKHRTNSAGRRRVENENGQSGRSGRGRYERHVIYKRDTIPASEMNYDKMPLPAVGEVYYVDIDDLLKTKSLNKMMKNKLNKMNKNIENNNKEMNITHIRNDDEDEIMKYSKKKDNKKKLKENNEQFKVENDEKKMKEHQEHVNGNFSDIADSVDDLSNNNGKSSILDKENFQRVKRKSGKTTGALSRPKGAGDTGSKSTSRKGDKDKGHEGDDGNFGPYQPDEEEGEEESEEEESDENTKFGEVSEIRFPGEVGPLGDRRLCKLRCVKGKWVGPLCATNEEDEHGHIKFQPLYKSCHVNRIPPHLLLSYRNISVNVGWDLPHGHSLQARCKDLGLYKLLGESRVLCSNGLWAPRMPSCVPTTLLTNFSDDSPPSIRIKIGSGSGAFEPSGVLAVLPDSTIHLDCMYPRARGDPEWTWTGWFKQYYTGWSKLPDEQNIKYRLTIKDIQNQDSGTFTCASPRGLTNSIPIIVATSQCPQLPEPQTPLTLRLEGNKLGQRALYRCPLGFRIEGTINSTCLASGNWSSPPPTCQSVQCPPLYLEDPHLSLTELNTSAWGRAVFKCQWGFKLSGPPGLECEPTGVWSGPVPRCRAIQCPQPLVPINGRIDGTSGSSSHRRYAVGALVTFSCTEGHLLVGEASIVCTETGFWSHPPPFCKSQCPYPGDPPNGLIAPLKFHYDPGDFLSVQCRPGFVEFSSSGPPERPRCLPDGQWSGPVPQCRSYEDV